MSNLNSHYFPLALDTLATLKYRQLPLFPSLCSHCSSAPIPPHSYTPCLANAIAQESLLLEIFILCLYKHTHMHTHILVFHVFALDTQNRYSSVYVGFSFYSGASPDTMQALCGAESCSLIFLICPVPRMVPDIQ